MRPVLHPERKAERDWFQLSAYRKRYLIDELHIHLLHYHEDKYIPLRHSLQDRFKKFCELMDEVIYANMGENEYIGYIIEHSYEYHGKLAINRSLYGYLFR